MDQKKQQQQKNLATTKLTMKRRAIQALVLVSIFLFSYLYSSCILWFLHNINEFITRKFMFVFCNLLLVLLAKDSGSFSSPPSKFDIYDEFFIRREDQLKSIAVERELVLEEKATLDSVELGEDEEEEEEEENYEDAYEEEEEEGGMEVGDEMEKLGVEELNKRFEAFIEKVKRDRRLEALQLVMVS